MTDSTMRMRAALRLATFPLVLLVPAGTWRWWEAWALFGIYVLYSIVSFTYLSRHDPELLRERLRPLGGQKLGGQKQWDKVVMLGMILVGLSIFIVPGLDVVRYHWSERLPVWVELAAMAFHLPCFVMIGAIMRANTFLSPVVKIDEARGHHVITTGPYAIVRHPLYAVASCMMFAVPLALGSRWGLAPAGVMVGLLIVRTTLEDRTLQAELPGYAEYAQKTRYRLIPGVW